MQDATEQAPAPGWLADPTVVGRLRYWDGVSWTASTAPSQSTTVESPIGQHPVDAGTVHQSPSWAPSGGGRRGKSRFVSVRRYFAAAEQGSMGGSTGLYPRPHSYSGGISCKDDRRKLGRRPVELGWRPAG